MPEAVVYKMIKAFYDKRDELVKLDPGFTPMAKDFVGMQVQGINANPTDPGASGPGQVPEGAQGLGRQVEGRSRDADRSICADGAGTLCAKARVPAPKFWRKLEHQADQNPVNGAGPVRRYPS